MSLIDVELNRKLILLESFRTFLLSNIEFGCTSFLLSSFIIISFLLRPQSGAESLGK